jgi:GUN4-like/TIR domain
VTEEAISVFLSYSRKDKDLLDSFAVHLAGLVNTGQITTWHDRDIEAGSEWEPAIQHQLNTAKIIILLISANFIASEYCYGNELKRAIERHDGGEAHVIPVILKPCLWNLPKILFSKLNVLPNDALPVTQWNDADAAFTLVVEHIARVVDRLKTERQLKREVEERQKLKILRQQEAERQRQISLKQQQQSHINLRDEVNWNELLADIPHEVIEEHKKMLRNTLPPETNQEEPTISIEQNPSLSVSLEVAANFIESVNLKSEKGIDYCNLRDLLRDGKWREADKETFKVMLKAANRESDGWLDDDSLQKFPCQDLKTINQLWVNASKGLFGFSVQKKIWKKCGSPMSYSDDWEKFGDVVGWRVERQWVNYSNLKFVPSPEGLSPKGELPFVCKLMKRWSCSGGFSSLMQRLVNCNHDYINTLD